MFVYIVVTKGAYGLQIKEVFTCPNKAEEYVQALGKSCNYEIIPKFAY